MQEVRYDITFLVDDDVSEEDIVKICGAAYLQIHKGEILSGWSRGEVVSIETTVLGDGIEIVPTEEGDE